MGVEKGAKAKAAPPSMAVTDDSGGEANHNQVVLQVPHDLTTLIRIIMRSFYAFELFLCMEMLQTYPCIKEEDLAELLRLDLKVVHQHLVNLKKEKFIMEKAVMETSADGKLSKHSYFYINYKMMVNIVKYKLDKIRIQIESEENQFTMRAQFKCTSCAKTYTDLETKDIFLTMQCLYCGGEVDEDTSCLPTRSNRNLLNKFNTQMLVIFDLLGRVEHVRLADAILRPEPIDMTHVLERINGSTSIGVGQQANSSNGNGGPIATGGAIGLNGKPIANGAKGSNLIKYEKWSGDKTRNQGDVFGQTRISINFDSSSGLSSSQSVPSMKPKRELPTILRVNATHDAPLGDSTERNGGVGVNGDGGDDGNRDLELLNSLVSAADETTAADKAASIVNKNNNNNNINSNTASKTGGPSTETPGKNGKSSAASAENGTKSFGGEPISAANLEAQILQKLLKHEKKDSSGGATKHQPTSGAGEASSALAGLAANSNLHHNKSSGDLINNNNGQFPYNNRNNSNTNSNINGLHPSKSSSALKRIYGNEKEGITAEISGNSLELIKKRKLNNGEIISDYSSSSSSSASLQQHQQQQQQQQPSLMDGSNNMNSSRKNSHRNGGTSMKRNHSDGSDRDDHDDDMYLSELSNDNLNMNNDNAMDQFDQQQNIHHHHLNLSSSTTPHVFVQGKMIPLDAISPKLVSMMDVDEKDAYINIIRELYTVMYEM